MDTHILSSREAGTWSHGIAAFRIIFVCNFCKLSKFVYISQRAECQQNMLNVRLMSLVLIEGIAEVKRL